MKAKTQILILFLTLAVSYNLFPQQTNTSIIAKVEIEKLADVINIKGTGLSKTDLIMSLRYEMFIYKKNKENGNVAKGEKSGRFVLQPSEKKTLAQISFNQNTKDKITVVLLVYDSEDKLLGKDRVVVLNDDENLEQKKQVRVTEDDISKIRGIVIEDTKTKPGRDFYVEFYSNYRLKGINGIEVVRITEQFSFGRSTIIEVSVGSTIVHRFFAQPKQDYIKQQSYAAIVNVTRYFLNLERQKNYINQY
ncbi:CsgE family curli-type amyloid fiber assembly protein [Winogradskyella litorisediminis]|uniref:Curli production assembly/transport component CsgE n=1 Tax=Winogradskyella litorisediminis TaxID=1156618 RepID=A0ABW3N963_9FLAO